jgi:tetratricopeptide (TPR) repeat protein
MDHQVENHRWSPTRHWIAPALAAVIVIAVYALIAMTVESETSGSVAANAYYNRLIDGLKRGQLNLAQDPPPALLALSDPYDPLANNDMRGRIFTSPRIHDLTFFEGKLYMYFSVIPAVVLFLPYNLVTGAYLSHQLGCLVFTCVGFLASIALFGILWRRYFPGIGQITAGLCMLGIGLAPTIPVFLQRPDVWEVPISCAYAFSMLSLLALWRILDRPDGGWIAPVALSVCAGLAAGSRPSEFWYSTLLIFPLFIAARAFFGVESAQRRRSLTIIAATILPIAVIGGGLLWYNYKRFGNALDFGHRYQLSGDPEKDAVQFSASYFWFNFRMYFLHYAGWSREFPFIRHGLPWPAMPAGHGLVENPVGLISSVPFIIFAAAVPLVFRFPNADVRRTFAPLVGAILWIATMNATLLCLFFATCLRYQMAFAPELIFLAALGVLALEDWARDRPRIRIGWRAVWPALLALSVGYNLLATLSQRADMETTRGVLEFQYGQFDLARLHVNNGLRIRPTDPEGHGSLGLLSALQGRFDEACVEYAIAVKYAPDSARLHCAYGLCLYRLSRFADAERELELSLSLQPDNALAVAGLRLLRTTQQSQAQAVH